MHKATTLQPPRPTAAGKANTAMYHTKDAHSRKKVRRLVEAQLEGHPEVNPCRNSISRLDNHPPAPTITAGLHRQQCRY